MKKLSAAALAAVAVCAVGTASAQEHWKEGPVWNCSYYQVLPGKWDEYMLYLRRNTLPLQMAQKKAGLVMEYRLFTKEQQDANDWNIAACTLHPSYGKAMDFDAAEDAKADEIAAAHWKTQDRDAQTRAAAARFELRKFIGSSMMRQVDLKPMP